MSRIGKRPIPIPSGVTVSIGEEAVEVKGPKGQLRQPLPPGITFEISNGEVKAALARDDGELRKFHGLARTLVANAVQGVAEGFKRELDIVGVGYRAEVKGKEVVFQLGYSHPVRFPVPEGIEVVVEAKTGHITVTGIDRQKVGQTAAEIRSLRQPDPYKGKGIKYSDEVIRRKAGKAAGK